MKYVRRDRGVIVEACARPQPGRAEEAVADNDAELMAFLDPPARASELEALKAALARKNIVTEAEIALER